MADQKIRHARSVLAAAMFAFGVGHGAQAQQALQPIRYTFANSVVSPTQINIVLPEILGYYKAEGLTLQTVPLNSDAGGYALLESGRVEFAGGGPPIQFAMMAHGKKPQIINVMEHTYPFKYGMAVLPDSPIKTLDDIRDKRIGVTGLGGTEYTVGRAVMRIIGLDPDKDVSWLAVGNNAVAGQALQRHSVDALYYYDTGFGTIESAGIKLRYLAQPAQLPKVGGIYVVTSTKLLKEHRPWVVGVMRAMLKAEIFIQTNPEAAAYEFTQMFPEATPKGKSVEEAVQTILIPIEKRAPLYSNYNKAAKRGAMSAEEWQAELAFANMQDKVANVSELYTNDLIDDANDFDAEAIREQARRFTLPYKK
jgi:NitT/TauT family transport system substrate-binding protein